MTNGHLETLTAEALVTSLAGLIRKYQMYPSGHPTIRKAIHYVKGQFAYYLKHQPVLEFGIGRDRVYIGEKEIKNEESVNSICSVLHENSVSRLTFRRGLRTAELTSFLETLLVDPLEARNHGGYKQLLSEKGVISIDVTEIDYKLEKSEIESQLDALSDAEIWRRFAVGRSDPQKGLNQEQSELMHHLLDNIPRLSLILDSVIGQNENTEEAVEAADLILNGLMNMAMEAKGSGAERMKEFGKQATELLTRINPKSRFVLCKQSILSSSKKTTEFFKILVAQMPDHDLSRSLFEGLNPRNSRMQAFCDIYLAFVPSNREQALLDQVEDFVIDYSFTGEKSHQLMMERAQQLPDSPEPLSRLRESFIQSSLKHSEKLQPLFAFMEQQTSDPDEDDARALREDLEQVAMINLLSVLDHVQEAAAYADFTKGLDEQIAILIRSGQYRLAWQAVEMLKRHADGENAEIRETAKGLLASLHEANLANELIVALRQWGKQEIESLGSLLLMLAESAHEPLLKALGEEEDRATRAVLIEILSKMGPVICESCEQYLSDSKWYMVRNMINLLAKFRPDNLVSCLEACSTYGEPRVRKEVARTLATVHTPEAIALLTKLTSDADNGVMSQAVLGLGQFRDSEQAADVLMKELEKRSPFRGDRATEKLALDSLGRIRYPGSIPTLVRYLSSGNVLSGEGEPSIRAAATALTGFDQPEALNALKKGAKSWTKTVRQACKDALAKTERGRS